MLFYHLNTENPILRPQKNFAVQGQKSKVKVTKTKTQWLQFEFTWWWIDARSLMWHRTGDLLFIKVIRQISSSPGPKNRRFWPKLSFSSYAQIILRNFCEGRKNAYMASLGVPDHRRLWNNAHSLLKGHRRDALLFFIVIHQLSMSHKTKNDQFGSDFSVSGW